MWRTVVDWSGGKIGTGFSNIYYTGGTGTPQQCADATRAFFASSYVTGSNLPNGIVLSFRASVDVVDSMTGTLSNQLPVTAPVSVNGSGTARYAALAGSCVTWRTPDFGPHGRIRGRTFLVPLDGAAMQADGTIDTTALGFINSAAATLIAAAPELVVWHRPTAPGASDGSYHVVTSGTAADRACFLTSRR
jgi:hypothetical protein